MPATAPSEPAPGPSTGPPASRRRPARVAAGTVAACAAAALVAGCTAAGTTASAAPSASPASPAPTAPTSASALQADYVRVVNAVLPSVVQITTDRGLGSGVVLDAKGDIVTNAHVVANATSFQVRLADTAKPLPATLVGSYPPDDIAVVKLTAPPANLHPASFGDSSGLAIGDIVLALGNPLGLTGSVTEGIVSAVGRTVTEPGQGGNGPGATLPQVVQTSAAINPGNSGGALADLQGKVVGIPTLAALDPQTGGSAAPGIGFAIPSNLVTDIAGQLVQNGGHVQNSHRADLGIGAVTVVDSSGNPAGVGVAQVQSGGPAAQAGVAVGEVITQLNGKDVSTTAQLSQILAGLDPGQVVTLTLRTQQGSTRQVQVTLGQLPGS